MVPTSETQAKTSASVIMLVEVVVVVMVVGVMMILVMVVVVVGDFGGDDGGSNGVSIVGSEDGDGGAFDDGSNVDGGDFGEAGTDVADPPPFTFLYHLPPSIIQYLE